MNKIYLEGSKFNVKEFKKVKKELEKNGWKYYIMDPDINDINKKKLIGYYIDKVDFKTKYMDIFRVYE